MEHITMGRIHNKGKVAFVQCIKDDTLKNVEIKNQCFLLIVLLEGKLSFELRGERIDAVGPCFLCFDEKENPKQISDAICKCFSIYFHPVFLNVNMTFDFIRSGGYEDVAHVHDMFLLKPFLDGCHVVQIAESHLHKIETACEGMEYELCQQRDWYWSCRGRSYFLEIMIALERTYGRIGHGVLEHMPDRVSTLKNPKLKDAILFIEGHYAENLTLGEVVVASKLNRTTLTNSMKEETGFTAMGYLMYYRVEVAKKHLAFTEVPIKDIAIRCGFKTVQHFSRIFKLHTGRPPADFRVTAVQRRRDEIK